MRLLQAPEKGTRRFANAGRYMLITTDCHSMPERLELERKQVKHVGQLCFGVVLGSNLWVVIPCF